MIAEALTALHDNDFSEASLEATLRALVETLETKPGVFFSLIRVVATGSNIAPGLFETLHTLGRNVTLERLRRFS